MDNESPHPDWRSEFQRLEGAYAPATMRSYYSDVEIFVAWCDRVGLNALPASVVSATPTPSCHF